MTLTEKEKLLNKVTKLSEDLDLADEIRAKKTKEDNSLEQLLRIKHLLFDEANSELYAQFESYSDDKHSVIFKGSDGQEYKLTVTRKN